MRIYLIGIVILFFSYFGVTKYFQLNFYNFFSPVILFLRESSLNVKDISVLILNLNEIRKENSKLKILLGEMETLVAQNQIYSIDEREIENLSNDFKRNEVLKNKKIISKKIIRYDSFGSKLILDNINNDPIKENDLVLIGENLIGLVKSNSNKIIEVKLISSKDLLINTQIINKDSFKIKTVLDSESGDSLVINNVLATENAAVGDLVVTANSNENLIPDLIIGKIQRIEGISSQTFRKAYLIKNYDLNLRNYVGVLMND